MKAKKPKETLFVVIGTFMMSFAVNSIYEPANLVTGGFAGIGIIIKNFIKFPVWLSTIVLNIPLFIVGYKVLGKRFIKKSLLATVLYTFFLSILPDIDIWNGDLFLAAVFGGVISGTGIGLILMSGSSTGGSDMLATIINNYKRHISVPRILQVTDGVIILCGAIVTGIDHTMYALVTVYIISFVSDGIIDGLKYGKAVFIISDKYEEIADTILNDIKRGVTAIEGMGMYSKEQKKVLLSVMSKKEIVAVREKVYAIDSSAFLIVYDVKEILGEGFVQNNQNNDR